MNWRNTLNKQRFEACLRVLSWLAILNNEIVGFSLIDVLFGKFDIEEDFIVINNYIYQLYL